jgi:hypothetical protein
VKKLFKIDFTIDDYWWMSNVVNCDGGSDNNMMKGGIACIKKLKGAYALWFKLRGIWYEHEIRIVFDIECNYVW